MNTTTRTKTCFKCNQTKPIFDFYKHGQMADGHLNKCKQCTRNDVTSHRCENVERIREYDKKRWRESPKRRAAITGRALVWQKQNPEKHTAHNKVNSAVRSGKIEKPSQCQDCGCDDRVIHGHHEDYSKPLEVEWLCPVCHSMRHH